MRTHATEEAPPGLDGVAVATTGLSMVDGEAGRFVIRGHDAPELAGWATVEHVWHLLHTGREPTVAQRDELSSRIGAAREIPGAVADVLPAVAAASEPGDLAALRTAVSLTGQALGCRSWIEQSADDTDEQCFRLAALMPVLAANLYRLARGEEPVDPDPALGVAANYLAMTEGSAPDPERVRALETYMVLASDHGFCNSTFTARVVASSGADVAAAISAAIGAFSGPLHGGAIGRVPSMLDTIGEPSNAEAFVRETLDRGERLPGFGHPVYKTVDPRARLLRGLAERFGGPRIELAEAVEEAAVRVINERKPGKRRESNVDFYAGVVLEQAGVPEAMFLSTFTAARVVGWTAHIAEQVAANRIFRPAARYVGGA